MVCLRHAVWDRPGDHWVTSIDVIGKLIEVSHLPIAARPDPTFEVRLDLVVRLTVIALSAYTAFDFSVWPPSAAR